MQQIRNVQVAAGGRKWNGSWEIEKGRVLVSSAYGSKDAAATDDHAANKAIAETLMREIATAR